jgi:hypothetical protein
LPYEKSEMPNKFTNDTLLYLILDDGALEPDVLEHVASQIKLDSINTEACTCAYKPSEKPQNTNDNIPRTVHIKYQMTALNMDFAQSGFQFRLDGIKRTWSRPDWAFAPILNAYGLDYSERYKNMISLNRVGGYDTLNVFMTMSSDFQLGLLGIASYPTKDRSIYDAGKDAPK